MVHPGLQHHLFHGRAVDVVLGEIRCHVTEEEKFPAVRLEKLCDWKNLEEKGMEEERMEEKKRLCGYYDYTVILTYLGMLAGFTGIVLTTEGAYRNAVLCLMVAGVCDMFDGTIAATKQRSVQEKRFGVQIDSLSDLICFGVLPALLGYMASGRNYLGFFAGCLYVLCALIRLAYFNVLEEERQQVETGGRTYFLGVPVTTVALVLPVFLAIRKRVAFGDTRLMPLVLIVMAAMFVLPLKVKKPQRMGKVGIAFTGLVEFIILWMGLGMDI